MFGEPIKMTYKGDDSFRTNFGACLTILFWIGIFAVIALQVTMYLMNLNTNI